MKFSISIASDDPSDFDFGIDMEIGQTPGPHYTPTDTDIINLVNAIVASDYVQNMTWLGTPQLEYIATPQDPRVVFP